MNNLFADRGGMIAILIICFVVAAGVAFAGLKIRKQTKVPAAILMIFGGLGMLAAVIAMFNTIFFGTNI